MNDNLVRGDKYENYLLVEGSDDKHVFRHLLDHYHIPQQFKIKDEHFEIKDHEGIDNLLNLKTLRTYLKIVDEPRRFGIVVDADTDLAARWQTLSDILKNSGYSIIPITPKPEGTILREDGRPVVGIWLMPDNKVPGMLEDFASFLRPKDDLLWPIANDVVQKVKVVQEDRRFRDTHESKARIHT